MSNDLAYENALRKDLLEFRALLRALEERRNAAQILALEISTLETVASHEADHLINHLRSCGLLGCPVILDKSTACIAEEPSDAAVAHEFIEYREWGALSGWDAIYSTNLDDDDTAIFAALPTQN